MKLDYRNLENHKGDEQSVGEHFLSMVVAQDPTIDDETKHFIRNWRKSIQACRQLARFYCEWDELIKPGNPALNDPMIEANRGIANHWSSLAQAQQAIIDAKSFRTYNFSDPNDPDKGMTSSTDPWADLINQDSEDGDQVVKEESQVKLGPGERIEAIIKKRIRYSCAGPETKKMIVELAQKNGVLPSDKDNEYTDPRLIRNLLNAGANRSQV